MDFILGDTQVVCKLLDALSFLAYLLSYQYQTSPTDVQRGINVLKLIRFNLSESELTPELESSRAAEYVKAYLECLLYGKSLPDTELQPADDLAILAGQAFVAAWTLDKDEAHLHNAVAILEYASARSKQSYRIRLLLIRLYHLIGRYSSSMQTKYQTH